MKCMGQHLEELWGAELQAEGHWILLDTGFEPVDGREEHQTQDLRR